MASSVIGPRSSQSADGRAYREVRCALALRRIVLVVALAAGSGCDRSALPEIDDGGELDLSTSDQTPSSCNDGLRDGEETDVDCGGSRCLPCAAGRGCSVDADCLNGACRSGACGPALTIDFAAPRLSLTAGPLREVVPGDFDGDGKLDLVGIEESGAIAVARAIGGGHFAPAVASTNDHVLTQLAVADFTRDGKLDVALASDGSFEIFAGGGDGTFDTFPIEQVGITGVWFRITVGDFDEDGQPDLILASSSGHAAIALAPASGGFAGPTPIALSKGTEVVEAFAVADLDLDGHLDLVAALGNGPAAGLAILFGDGKGALSAPHLVTATSAAAIVVGDWNGDGRSDLVVSEADSNGVPTGVLSIHLGMSGGQLQAGSPIAPLSGARLAAADLDGDGHLDLVVADTGGRSAVLFGDGGGGFGAPVVHSRGDEGVFIGDFTGDGTLDLLSSGGATEVLVGDGHGKFTDALLLPRPSAGSGDAQAVDLNGDGKLDLVFNSIGSVDVLLGNGDGTFREAQPMGPGFARADSLEIADLDGDGHLDLTVPTIGQQQNAGGVAVWLGRGDGTFGPPAVFPVDVEPFRHALGDLDGDGKLDAVVYSDGAGGSVTLLLGDGRGGFGPGVTTSTDPSCSDALSILVTDFDGDGKGEVTLACFQDMALLKIGMGGGLVTAGTLVTGPVWGQRAVDWNADGRIDLLVSAYRSGQILALFGNGDATFQPFVNLGWVDEPGVLALADFDSDGKIDVAARVADGFAILRQDDQERLQAPLTFGTGGATFHAIAGDFNSDGKPDLVGDCSAGPSLLSNTSR
jgi:hypothetical protein